jgi:TolB protein
MDANGGGKKNVSNSGYLDYAPAFSPDGTRIAFVRRGTAVQIWVMNADGSGQRRLTNPSPGYEDGKPSWSPDGTHIAFQRCCGPGAGIFTMLADGSGQTNVSGAAGDGPDWSPDGTRIVFGRYDPELSGSDAYVMAADGSGQTRLTVGLDAVNPRWSPDGTRIALEATYQCVRGIYSVTSTGGAGVTMIAEGLNPAWQPIP